jgi:hypothetical protein
LSEKANPRPRAYRVVAAQGAERGEKYTVEIDDGTRPVRKLKGFRTRDAADAWIAEEQKIDEAARARSVRDAPQDL